MSWGFYVHNWRKYNPNPYAGLGCTAVATAFSAECDYHWRGDDGIDLGNGGSMAITSNLGGDGRAIVTDDHRTGTQSGFGDCDPYPAFWSATTGTQAITNNQEWVGSPETQTYHVVMQNIQPIQQSLLFEHSMYWKQEDGIRNFAGATLRCNMPTGGLTIAVQNYGFPTIEFDSSGNQFSSVTELSLTDGLPHVISFSQWWPNPPVRHGSSEFFVSVYVDGDRVLLDRGVYSPGSIASGTYAISTDPDASAEQKLWTDNDNRYSNVGLQNRWYDSLTIPWVKYAVNEAGL